jgi:hypothetical protein
VGTILHSPFTPTAFVQAAGSVDVFRDYTIEGSMCRYDTMKEGRRGIVKHRIKKNRKRNA